MYLNSQITLPSKNRTKGSLLNATAIQRAFLPNLSRDVKFAPACKSERAESKSWRIALIIRGDIPFSVSSFTLCPFSIRDLKM